MKNNDTRERACKELMDWYKKEDKKINEKYAGVNHILDGPRTVEDRKLLLEFNRRAQDINDKYGKP